MAIQISNLAQVAPQAELGDDVEIGPFCVVGPHVRIGAGTVLQSHVSILGHTTIGCDNRFFANSVIGGEPQDLSYRGAPTRVEIGDFNVFREGVTVSRGAEKDDHVTRIGNHNMLMSNTHVAHNCHLHNHVILVNGALLGGHVVVYDRAIISGNSAVHHFSSLGTLSFIGGCSRVPHDVPPFMLASGGDDFQIRTINLVGLQRRSMPLETIKILKRAHRLLFREFKNLNVARQILHEELAGEIPAELQTLFEFLEAQSRGHLGRACERRRAAA
jgi:UDP-N-acetylglucosamine acyltransferase